MSRWAMEPASSRSLLVTPPLGLADETRSAVMCGGKRQRQRTGRMAPWLSGMKCTPPMPAADASHAPSVWGSGAPMTSTIRVGRVVRSLASHHQSWRNSWTGRVSRSRLPAWPSGWRNASCRVLKSPLPPGMAMVMDRSSPRSLCHVFRETRRWSGRIESSMACKRAWRCAGRLMVPRTVSVSHPRTVLRVAQVASPFSIFLTEAGSCLAGLSVAERGRRTPSSVWRRTRFTRRLSHWLPWARPMKSST